MTEDVATLRNDAHALTAEWERRHGEEWENSEFRLTTARSYALVIALYRAGLRSTASFSKGPRFAANRTKDQLARVRVREQIDAIRAESDQGDS